MRWVSTGKPAAVPFGLSSAAISQRHPGHGCMRRVALSGLEHVVVPLVPQNQGRGAQLQRPHGKKWRHFGKRCWKMLALVGKAGPLKIHNPTEPHGQDMAGPWHVHFKGLSQQTAIWILSTLILG